MYIFDYQQKIWGSAIVSKSMFSLAGLRFFYFLKAIQNVKGKLLEIGCGAGGNLQGLRAYRPYLELYGVDIGEGAIKHGQQHFPVLKLKVGSAENLPYGESEFDAVCFFDVLEHVANPQLCLNEASRVLKPKGIMHAYVPVEGEFLSLHGILNRFGINLKEKTAGHIQKLTRNEVERMCIKAEFEIKSVYWSCHLLNQIGDLLYYAFLTVNNLKLEESLEGSLEKQRNLIVKYSFKLIKNITSLLWYWESRLLYKFPGAGIHITCVKK